MTLDNVTVVWALVTIAVAVVALCIGYLLGQADGLREGMKR